LSPFVDNNIHILKRTKNSALKNPANWLATREIAMKNLSVELAAPYYKAIEKYKTLYPIDEAIELANRDIKGLFEMRMRQMEIDQPGSSLLFQGAALENNLNATMGNKFLNILSGQNLGPSKEEFKRYYKEKRARKKAKRAKKSEGK
jgi:hypothetical protein